MSLIKLLFCVSMAAILAIFSVIPTYATHPKYLDKQSDEMVYASRYEQHRVFEDSMNYLKSQRKDQYNELFVDGGYYVVEESITPLYRIDCFQWHETGKLIISRPDDTLGYGYYGSVFNANNTFCGLITPWYCYGSGYAGNSDLDNFEPGFQGCSLLFEGGITDITSASYADHAERIRTILGLSEQISPDNVRLVNVISNIACPMFYIKTDAVEGFIPTGFMAAAMNKYSNTFIMQRDRFIGIEEMKKYADKLYEINTDYVARKKEFRKQYPSAFAQHLIPKSVDIAELGFMFDENYSDLNVPINNITDCYEYLGLDPAIHYPGADPWKIILASCAAAVVIAASFVIVRGVGKKKTGSDS